MLVTTKPPQTKLQPIEIRWEKLPDDYPIPDDPVDNINQPLLAAALTDALRTANRLPEAALTPTNYPICATYNDVKIIKAPDWAYIPQISVPIQVVDRSYTPNLQGDLPCGGTKRRSRNSNGRKLPSRKQKRRSKRRSDWQNCLGNRASIQIIFDQGLY
jgi:hypothetical protein